MASRHVDVSERRLRPVYDALDSMNNKLAIQLADKILKKQKDLHCAKVLKALALLRSGKPVECSSLMEEVRSSRPADDSTLQAMTICYREMQKPECIPLIYEEAVKLCPKNEEFHTHLFMAYVRVGDYMKQQKAAMSLYKAFPKNPYYFWAVMSIVMQSITASDKKLSQTMFLPLAERMVEKLVREEKIEAEAEVHLYLLILEKLEKYERALEVLKSNLGEKLVSYPNEKEDKEAEYLHRLGRWAEASQANKRLLTRNPDQWSYYQAYFNSVFHLIKEDWKPIDGQEDIPDHTTKMVEKFISSLSDDEEAKDKKASRGPFLAHIELYKQIHDRECTDTREEPRCIFSLLLEYFHRFGDKTSCYSDLAPYLRLIGSSKKHIFIEMLKSSLPTASDGDSSSVLIKLMYRRICIEQFSRHLGLHDDLAAEEKISLAKEYIQLHRDGLKYGSELISTELQYSDHYALLAAHLLLDVNEQKGTTEMFWHCLILLESVLKASSSNHHMKLLLIRIYCLMDVTAYHLKEPPRFTRLLCASTRRRGMCMEPTVYVLQGAYGPCVELCEGMEIKHIEHDTMGYLSARFVEAVGHFKSAATFYTSIMKFYSGNQKDTPEYTIAAYKYGSFEKIPEFVAFRKRVNLSAHFSLITFEKMLLDVLQKANSLSGAQDFFAEINLLEKCPETKDWLTDLQDNRDLRLNISWNPADRQLTKEDEQLSTQHELMWLRQRCFVLRALALTVTLVPKPVQNAASPDKAAPAVDGELGSSSSLQTVIENLDSLFEEAENHSWTRGKSKPPFLGPVPSRISGFVKGEHDKVLMSLLRICHCLHHLQEGTQDGNMAEVTTKIKDLMTVLIESLKVSFSTVTDKLTAGEGDKKTFNGVVLEPLVLLVETLNHACLVSAVCCSLIHRVAGSKRSKKKKATPSPMAGVLELWKSFLDLLKSSSSKLLSSLVEVEVNQLDDSMLELSLTEMDKETHSSVVSEIWEKIQTSYKQSVKEISGLLKHKVDFAKTLRV